MKKSELIFRKGYEIVEKDLDIANLLKTIHQLKAGVSAIIQNDDAIIERCKEIYLNNTTIYEDSDEEQSYKVYDKFNEFLSMGNPDLIRNETHNTLFFKRLKKSLSRDYDDNQMKNDMIKHYMSLTEN